MHLEAAYHLLSYLKTFPDVQIIYHQGSGTCIFDAYVNADWGNSKDRQSTSGYLIMVGGSPISWKSKIQPTVATSTTEAEYIATKDVVKEIIWLRQMFKDLGHPQPESTLLREDNTRAMELAKNPINHNNTKHIDITYHFIREKIKTGEIIMEHIDTHLQAIDMLTKPLNREK